MWTIFKKECDNKGHQPIILYKKYVVYFCNPKKKKRMIVDFSFFFNLKDRETKSSTFPF